MGLASKLREAQMETVPTGPPPPTPPPSAIPDAVVKAQVGPIFNKLRTAVEVNKLHGFYRTDADIQKVADRLAGVDFDGIAKAWRMPKELIYDMAPLALYDVVFYCDDSGSMAFAENGERIEDLKVILGKVADVVARFDDDGISVRFMNSSVVGDNIRSGSAAVDLVSRVTFNGMTPLGTEFDNKIIKRFVRSNMPKPVLAIVITDGEPTDKDRFTILNKIRDAATMLDRTPLGRHALAVQIAQVGKDVGTQKFLGELDTDTRVGDMIDCTSYYELEAEEMQKKNVTLTPELWLLKMCVGAIDPTYDGQDE